jgi:YD repeat-containing protein
LGQALRQGLDHHFRQRTRRRDIGDSITSNRETTPNSLPAASIRSYLPLQFIKPTPISDEPTNPEQGTFTCGQETVSLCYTYLDSGDMHTRTDARGVVTTYGYDELHRIRTKTYTNDPQQTPTVTYTYYVTGAVSPKVGQLQSVTSTQASTVYDSYNALGQIIASTHTIAGYSGSFSFPTYDWFLYGSLKRIQYPSGLVVDYQVDDAGRVNKVLAGTATYADMTATGITNPYAPDGRLAKMLLGNGLYDTRDYQNAGNTHEIQARDLAWGKRAPGAGL